MDERDVDPAAAPVARRPRMADYGVPADLEGVLPWSWAEERLVRCRNYWVVTVDASGRPHSLPVWGVWRPSPAAFVFSCSPNARKARNIAANPRVCVTIDDTVECVSVEGRAAPLAPGDERVAAVAAYAAKYAEPGGHDEMAAFVDSHAVFVVHPERAIAIIERVPEFSQAATAWDW